MVEVKTKNKITEFKSVELNDEVYSMDYMRIRADFDIISNPNKFPEEKVKTARENLLLLYDEILLYSSHGKKISSDIGLIELPKNIEELAVDIEELIKEAKAKRTHITLEDDPEDLIELEEIPEDPGKEDRDKVNKAVWKQIEKKNGGG